MLCCCCRLPAEGDLYFTAKLQNYTAVEKDEAILSCELSKAAGEVKWFKDGNEIFPSKNVLLQSDGRKRLLVIKKTAKNNVGSYTCDCGTDKTTADLNIEGNPRGGPARCPKEPRQDCRIRPRPPPFIKTRLLIHCCVASPPPVFLLQTLEDDPPLYS